MKVNKTLLPAHREASNHSPEWYQTECSQTSSVGQNMGDLMQVMRREAMFCLQLVLAFSVSYTAVQLTRDWLSHSGMIAPAPSAYSARVFWPENTLALFPKPSIPAAQAAASAPEPDKASAEAAPKQVQAPTVSLSHTPEARRQAAARLHISPLRNQNAYRWASPSARVQPRVQSQARYTARRQARVAVKARPPQPKYRSSPRLAAVRQAPQSSQAVKPIRRILSQDYKVSKLKSYEEYMSWVRRTLKDYNGG